MVPNKENMDELWNTFKSGIQETMFNRILSQIFKKKHTAPWLNRNLKRRTRCKARL